MIRFLKGLNSEFATIRSQILIMDPVPTINKVFALSLQHERQIRGIPNQEINESTVLYASRNQSIMNNQRNQFSAPKKYPSSTTGKKPTCTYCGFYGHSIDKCYKKHGYPPGFKFANKNHSGGIINQVESINSAYENEATNFVKDAKGKQVHVEESDSKPHDLVFTKEQYQQLINLINVNSQSAGCSYSSANNITTNSEHLPKTGIFFSHRLYLLQYMFQNTIGFWILGLQTI